MADETEIVNSYCTVLIKSGVVGRTPETHGDKKTREKTGKSQEKNHVTLASDMP